MKLLKYNTKISSDLRCICTAITDIISFLEDVRGPLDECALFELKVILNELLINAVKHGNGCDCSKTVKVMAALTKRNYVFILIEDEGTGFNYRAQLHNRKTIQGIEDLCGLKETGRGMLIVSSLCERMRFNRRGNKVMVLKKI